MTIQSRTSGSDFWIAWVLANWVASLAARWMLDAFRTYDQLSGAHIPAPFDGLVVGAAIGVVAGIFQWLMLRRQVYQTTKWAIATLVGWTIGMAFGWPIQKSIGGVQGEIISLALLGLVIGLLQWFILREYIYYAGWWMLTSGMAWATGLYIIGWVIAGFVFVRLWQRPKQDLSVMPVTKNTTNATPTSMGSRLVPSRLRQDSILVAQWVGLSILGQFALFFGSGFLIILFVIIAGAAVGLLLGTMQWVVLRGNVSKAFLWIFANILGGAIGGVAGLPIVGLFLITISAIAGPLLVWYLHHPSSKGNRTKPVSTV